MVRIGIVALALALAVGAQAAPPKKLGKGEGAVSIVAWAGYIERGETDKAYDWVTGFEKETGCKVSVKTAATSDEMVALMNEGGFDLVTASGDASLRLVSGGRVQEINTALVPSWSTVDPRLQNAPWHTVERQALRRARTSGARTCSLYNTKVFEEAAHELERRLRGDDASRRQVQQGPGAGLRRADLHRRRRPVPQAPQARAGDHGPLRAGPQAVRRGAGPPARAAQARGPLLARRHRRRSTTS